MRFFDIIGRLWQTAGKSTQFILVFGFLVMLAGVVMMTLQAGGAAFNADEMPPSPTAFVPPPLPGRVAYVSEPEEAEGEYIPEPAGPVSLLTGLEIEEEYLQRRPLAIAIDNAREAWPQSGIASADIIYEVLAEGNVTRFVAVFQTYVPAQIGPVRSARDYFVDFTLNHDAILVFHGASPGGYTRVRNLMAGNFIDGMRLEGTVFYRDRTFPDWAPSVGRRALEHSSYTGRTRLLSHIESNEIRDYANSSEFGFDFGETPDRIRSVAQARTIEVPFAVNFGRTFLYNPTTGLYNVYNTQGPHRDALNREQASVSNVIVQFASMRVIDGIGRRAVDTVGQGTGLLFRNGVVYELDWTRANLTTPTRWYFAGTNVPMLLEPGQTWICVFQAAGEVRWE